MILAKCMRPVLAVFIYLFARPSFAAPLELISYDAKSSGIAEKSVIVLGQRQAVLIDAQWKPSDASNVAEIIADAGRELTHILITHGHPDHYWGLETILKRFPEAMEEAVARLVEEAQKMKDQQGSKIIKQEEESRIIVPGR